MKRRKLLRVSMTSLAATLGISTIGGMDTFASTQPEHLVMTMAWSGAAIQKTMTDILNQYNKTHPGVVWSLQPAVKEQKLLAEIAAGTGPSVSMLDTTIYVPTYATKGAIEPLEPWIKKSNFNLAQFTPASLYSNSLLGQQYALPFFEDTYALYYNKALLQKAGIKSPPTTLEQLMVDAKKLTITGPNGQYTQLGFDPSGFGTVAASLWGGRLATPSGKVTATSPAVEKGISWLANYWNVFNPSKLQRFLSSNGGAASTMNTFTAGKVAMMISGEWFMPNIIQQAPHMSYGVAAIPYPTGYSQFKNVGSVGGNPLVVPKGAKDPAQAWDLIQWLATTGEQIGIQPTNYANILAVPALKSLVNNSRLAPSPQMSFFWKYSEGSNIIPFPAVPDALNYAVALIKNMQLAEINKESVQQALQTVQNQIAPMIASDLQVWRSTSNGQ